MPNVHASTYNKEKFRELIVYLAKKSEADPRLGAMKWNKLMFFADREAYGRLGHSISGARYHKIEHGPAAAALVPVRDEMLDSGELEIKPVDLGPQYKPQNRVVAHREPDESVFSADERAVMDEIIKRYWDYNGTAISQEAYNDLGVALAEQDEDIPYGTVYLPKAEPTKAEVSYAQRRMKERGWA